MKVLILASQFPKPFSPYCGFHNYEFIKYQANFHDIHIISPTSQISQLIQNTRSFLSLRTEDPTHSEMIRALIDLNIQVHYPQILIDAQQSPSLGFKLSIISRLVPAVRKIRQTFPFDLIHAFSLFPDGMIGGWLARVFNTPLIMSMPGVYIENQLLKSGRKLQTLLDRSQGFLIPGKQYKSILPENLTFPKHTSVLSPGVDILRYFPRESLTARKKLGLPTDRRLLLYLGDCAPNDGLNYIIDAMELLNPRHNDLSLIVLGNGPLLTAAKRKVQKLGIEESILFYEHFHYEELPIWLNAVDLFLYPNPHFGGPVPILQAMACGTPVIAAKFDGIREFLPGKDLGAIVNQRDTNAWVDQIENGLEKVWNEYDLVTRAKKHNLHKQTATLNRCYKQVLQSNERL